MKEEIPPGIILMQYENDTPHAFVNESDLLGSCIQNGCKIHTISVEGKEWRKHRKPEKIKHMTPVYFEGAVEIGKPTDMTDEQCFSVWAERGIDKEGFPYFFTAWKPSYEDLKALNAGGNIYVKVLSTGLPPMSIFTLDENNQHNDAG